MNRLEALNQQILLFGHTNLATICLALRAAVNGSSEKWHPDKIRATVEMLKLRKDTWQRSYREVEEALDEAFYCVVCATITEVEKYKWWQVQLEKESAQCEHS